MIKCNPTKRDIALRVAISHIFMILAIAYESFLLALIGVVPIVRLGFFYYFKTKESQ
ncbi:MAG: hypothetical protein K0U38_05290 [Epsilonproteobacteria bacterium]|nr:hypothetical protein [Campylobacterota bacterium]